MQTRKHTRDHYVAQTYLKNFAGSDGLLHAFRKSDGKHFPSRPRDVCHEWNGDLIEDFLSDPAALAKYRKIFEPAWNPAINEITSGPITSINKLAIAGYWANLLVFTPTSRRLDLTAHDRRVIDHLRARDTLSTEAGKPDAELKRILVPFETGEFQVETKPDAMRAMRATQLWKFTWLLYNSNWIVMVNETNTEFLTSDNPVSFDDPGQWRGQRPSLPRYFPLTPRVCLYCDMSEAALTLRRDSEPDFSRTPQGILKRAQIPLRGIREVNRAVVQCAEDLVFSSTDLPSIDSLVKEYARYRVEMDFIEIRKPGSILHGMSTRVRERTTA
jgi:hypothetical protein